MKGYKNSEKWNKKFTHKHQNGLYPHQITERHWHTRDEGNKDEIVDE